MHSKMKKILVFALVLTMLMPIGSAFASEEETAQTADAEAAEETAEEAEELEDDESVDIDTKTTVEYVSAVMNKIGSEGDYNIYTGTVKVTGELEDLIDDSEKVIEDKDEYTAESYQAYEAALENAKAAFENIRASQYQLDSAWIALDRAEEGLVKADKADKNEDDKTGEVDKSKLEKAYEKLDDDLVSSDYTVYTWKIYQDAVKNAENVIADSGATQAEVDAAKEELDYTEDMLTENPSEIIAVTCKTGSKEVLMATFDVSEAEEDSDYIVSSSKEGFWVVETDADCTQVTNFYIRLLSHNVEDAFTTVDMDNIYYMNPKSLEIESTYAYESEDDENGRKYVSEDGRIAYTTLDGKRLLADIELVTENENLALYADSESKKVALYDKDAEKYWWSTPVDPYGDSTVIDETKGSSMALAERKKSASGLILEYGDLRQEKRNVSSKYSGDELEKNGKETWKISKDSLTITYSYEKLGFEVPVQYILHDDRLEVTVVTADIVESDTNTVDGKIITALTMAPSFGAASSTDLAGNEIEGYMIVPDGSGAVIEYNNGKSNYETYSQILYGRDLTTVPLTAPKVTEQAYLPVIATVSGNTGLVAVATDGDTNATVNAMVSGQKNQAFNSVYFTFTLRSKDEYYMSGDNGKKITVFEKGDIKTEKISLSYYPVSTDENDEVNYADVAEVYRNYLINEKGLEKKTEADTTNFYVDFYGGVLKETSVLGIPVDMKTEITGFNQASELLKQLSDGGVSDIVVNYNDWTNKSMTGKISTKFDPSGVLGGESDYEDLVETASSLDAVVFPSITNMEITKNTWGYMSINSTAIRVSNAQSRQSDYSVAFGVALSGKAPALLTPNSYSKAMSSMIESYSDNEVTNIGFGDYSSSLVSDFSKRNALSREGTMKSIVESYENASKTLENIIADEANSYIIPYADYITNVPVYSSQYNVVDYDIPLYQMVIHGYVPYSSTAVNANSNPEEVFLLSIASGSGIHYDMIYEEAYELLDTDYSDLYYANYKGWMDEAIAQYNASKEILSQVNDMVITDYQIDEETGVITTTYGDSVVITVDTKNATADVNGTVYDLSSALEGGLQG